MAAERVQVARFQHGQKHVKKVSKNTSNIEPKFTNKLVWKLTFFRLEICIQKYRKRRPKGSQMEAKIQPKCTPRRSPERLWHQLGPKKPPGHQKYPKYDLQAPQNGQLLIDFSMENAGEKRRNATGKHRRATSTP